MRKIGRFATITGILAMSLVPFGCGKSTQGSPAAPVPEVSVAIMREERLVITTELPGRTYAYLVAEVRPQVSGIIQKRLFAEGSDVNAGDVLYQIDPASYQASYDNAKAALAKAEANLPSVQSRVDRYKELVDIRAVSRQDYDDAAAALKQAQAEIQIAKAAVETARINLAYTHITAPISGRIGKSDVTVGALATAHQGTAFATIQELDPIYVDATQSSANLLRLKQNMAAGRIKGSGAEQARVKLLLEDGTAYPLEGTLKFSDITVEPSTGSFILRMVFPNPKHTLLPGMYVRAIIQEGVVEHAILAPQQAVSRDAKGNPLALVVDAQSKVQQRVITIDRALGDKWLVAAGLTSGDRVIIEGLQKVRPGASARIVPLASASRETSAATGAQGSTSGKAN